MDEATQNRNFISMEGLIIMTIGFCHSGKLMEENWKSLTMTRPI